MTPTTFILGAGASAPYGFPSGRRLLLEMSSVINRGSRLRRRSKVHHDKRYDALFRSCQFEKLEAFGKSLARSHQPSVDYFVEHRPEFMDVGKKAIVAFLMPYEDNTELLSRSVNTEQKWYEYFYQQISTTPEDFAESNVSIVTFNYDRSLERFLFSALKNSHGLSDEETLALLGTLPIVHAHGQLGPLGDSEDEQERSYDMEVKPHVVKARAEYISIMPEDIDGSSNFEKAIKHIEEARRICFLGFGYADQNLRRLKIRSAAKEKQIWGTAYDIQSAERYRVREALQLRSDVSRLGGPNKGNLDYLRQDIRLR